MSGEFSGNLPSLAMRHDFKRCSVDGLSSAAALYIHRDFDFVGGVGLSAVFDAELRSLLNGWILIENV
jgi:hypothetical protein